MGSQTEIKIMPLLLGAYFFLLLSLVSASLTTEYYKQLISQESAKALLYQLPKKNEEFRTGFESNAINGKETSNLTTTYFIPVFRLW